MNLEKFYSLWTQSLELVIKNAFTFATLTQVGFIVLTYLLAYLVGRAVNRYISNTNLAKNKERNHPVRRFCLSVGHVVFPVLAILFLRVSVEISQEATNHGWLIKTAMVVAILLLVSAIITDYVKNPVAANLMRWLVLPILFMHLLDILPHLIEILQSIAINVGNISVSAYGVLRVVIFGSVLFWFGRVSSSTGQEIIRRQEKFDFRTREVAAKLLEVAIFVVFFLLLLQVMGINLTALAVFGGALGVGLGFGLQAIASNFISGIIILLDRSLSIGDYVEMEDGKAGVVREMNMRSTLLETFDGKDIMVPNEKFIASTFINWTHKNKKQRYRVDFSVAYHSDIRKLVEIIKAVVSAHDQVMSGEAIPIEERPDCEIHSFGDSGINMFVEFWMLGIDDGKNRVGGDLLLIILEALQDNGYEIPFPQREIRLLKPNKGTAD
jgi:small-conductance mechanosensitive channel